MKETKLFFFLLSFFVFNVTFAMEEDTDLKKVSSSYDLCSLLEAIDNGSVGAIKTTLHNVENINLRYVPPSKTLFPLLSYYVPLHLGVDKKSMPIVSLLLGRPEIDINLRCGANLESALHIAVSDSNRNLEVIKLLVKNGASLGVQDQKSMTPLHTAIATDDKEIVEAMLTIPQDTMKLPCLFTLLCCFKIFARSEPKIVIPKDIQLMLCRYALRAGVDNAVDIHLRALQPCLEIEWCDLTPQRMMTWRGDCLASKEYEHKTMTDEQYNKEKSNLKVIAALLDPEDDSHRRKVIYAGVCKEFMGKIPGVSI